MILHVIKKTYHLLFLLIFVVSLSSCHAAIEDTAANSLAAILAVLFEYIYAIIALLLTFLLKLIRPLSIATIILGILGLAEIVDLSVSPIIFTLVGVALLFSFFIPDKPYFPKVIISKNLKELAGTWDKQDNEEKKRSRWVDFLLALLVGIVLLMIEYKNFAS